MLVQLVTAGITGAVVAVAYLFFKFLDKKSPNPRRRDALWLAAAVAIVAIGAVIAGGYIESRKFQSPLQVGSKEELESDDYVVEHSVLDVDLTGWKAVAAKSEKEKQSPATITRRDLIQKNTSTPIDYVYQFWTSGLEIDAESLLSYPKPEFTQLKTEADGTNRKQYQLRLPLASLPKGAELPMFTRFTFWNAFQRTETEDWRARIQYPTRAASVAIRFPAAKKVASVAAFLAGEDGIKIPNLRALSETNPVLLQSDASGSQIALWAGLNIPGRHVILFEWKWSDR